MKSLLLIGLGLLVTLQVGAVEKATWCTCAIDGVEILAPSPNHGGKYFDIVWKTVGTPEQNNGKSCGKGGFILDEKSNIVVGPLSKDIGNFLSCYRY